LSVFPTDELFDFLPIGLKLRVVWKFSRLALKKHVEKMVGVRVSGSVRITVIASLDKNPGDFERVFLWRIPSIP